MRSPERFLFDADFGAADKAKSAVTLAEHAARLADVEVAGYRSGFTAAKAEAEQHAAAALERIAASTKVLRAASPRSRRGSKRRQSKSRWRLPRSSRPS